MVRLTPAREKALNIVLNNREAQGRFDPRKLTELLSQLDGQSEFDLTGFDQADFRAMDLQPIESLAPAEEPNAMLICLTVPREKYDELSPKVELLVREFDLECHVKEL